MSNTIMQCLIALKAAYPRQELNDETIDIYMATLQDIDPALLKAAVLRHIATSKWFPAVAELRESATAIVMDATGDLNPSEAWGELMTMFRRGYSIYKKPSLPPMMEKALTAIGGWSHICHSENITADRARFIEAYGRLLNRKANDVQMLPDVQGYTENLKRAIAHYEDVHAAIAQVAAQKMIAATTK